MNLSQRFLAQALLSAGLSQSGFIKAMKVMTLEDVVRLMENDKTGHRDAERYHFAIFGKPSPAGVWGWRVEGHHLSLNFVIRNGRLVSSTPTFFGGNPHEAPEGPLFKPRNLAAAEVPLPEGIAEADYVVVGKVVGVEDKTVSASPFPGSPAKIAYRVVTVKPSEVLHGEQGRQLAVVGLEIVDGGYDTGGRAVAPKWADEHRPPAQRQVRLVERHHFQNHRFNHTQSTRHMACHAHPRRPPSREGTSICSIRSIWSRPSCRVRAW